MSEQTRMKETYDELNKLAAQLPEEVSGNKTLIDQDVQLIIRNEADLGTPVMKTYKKVKKYLMDAELNSEDFKYVYSQFRDGHKDLNVDPSERSQRRFQDLLPDVRKHIYDFVGYIDRLKLCKVAHFTRAEIEDYQEGPWTTLSIIVQEGVESNVSFKYSIGDVNVQKLNFWYSATKSGTKIETSNETANKPKMKYLEDGPYYEIAFADLGSVIKRKKFSTLDLTVRNLCCGNQTVAKKLFSFMETIGNNSLDVSTFHVHGYSFAQSTTMVAKLKPEKVHSLTLTCEGNARADVLPLTQLEHWKNVKKFKMHCDDKTICIQNFAPFYHMAYVDILSSPSAEDIAKLKEDLRSNSEFQDFRILLVPPHLTVADYKAHFGKPIRTRESGAIDYVYPHKEDEGKYVMLIIGNEWIEMLKLDHDWREKEIKNNELVGFLYI